MDDIRQVRDLHILFLGAVVPDRYPENQTLGFVRSGNNAQLGIVEGLFHAGASVAVLSGQPMAAFPGLKRLWCPHLRFALENGIVIETIPSPNFLFVRELFRGLWAFFRILNWSLRHRGVPRAVVTYNVYTPPLPFVYRACRLARTSLVPITFDLGMPPADFGWLRNGIYRFVEAAAKFYLPRCSGRVVITKRMGIDYGRGQGFLLVEGGVSDMIIERSKTLGVHDVRQDGVFRLVCAGSLWSGNGVELLLSAMSKIDLPDVELCFAGVGELVPEILAASKRDSRIKYLGLLSVEALFELYRRSDLLLNLRLSKEVDLPYLFPSKILECLSTGIPVLSTCIVDGMEEYNGVCCFLKIETPDALAAEILRIRGMSHVSRMEMGRRAQDMIFSRKTWNAQAGRIADYIQEVIEAAGGAK